jgi:hypothetical protein
VAIGLSAFLPASAAAQDPNACLLGGGPWEYQARLSQLLSR